MVQPDIVDVKSFWDSNPCQSKLSEQEDRRLYFEEIARRRFQGREWHIPVVARFDCYRGKDVLEVGCGVGTDGIEFARRGANYAGVDLTSNSVKLAQERFNVFGIPGRFEVANAEERLPFSGASFDHIYSWGVIHHSPCPEKIVREMHRVLKKGGTFTVMLYNRTSINYYVEIMFFRKLFKWCLLPKFMPRLLAAITGFDRSKLEGHREILMNKKNISKEDWISMNTDGPFCPLARVYSKREAAALFGIFGDVKQEVWEFNVDHWPYVRRIIPQSVERWLGRRWGWSRVIYGKKV